MIQTRDLTRRYGALTAVSRVNLDVPANSIFGFIGPNGAGKTTTLRMLATLLRPTSGEIHIDGTDVLDDAMAVRRKIGFLSDNFGLYDDMKVWEYVDYFAGAYNVESPSDAVERAIYQVQLTGKTGELVGRLSRGMRQRLGIARILVYEPK